MTDASDDDRALVRVEHWGDEAHDGPGWYYYFDEYPEEGSCGAFATREECEAHARQCDCEVAVLPQSKEEEP